MRNLFLISIAALLLTGCFAKQVPPVIKKVPLTWLPQQNTLQNFTHWRVRGTIRLHCRTTQLYKFDKCVTPWGNNWRGYFDWQQAGSHYQFTLTPAGIGHSIEVHGNSNSAYAELLNPPALPKSIDTQHLLANNEKWGFHFRTLSYWLRALADPSSSAAVQYNFDRQPARIIQDSWNIVLTHYQALGPYYLPTHLVLTASYNPMAIEIKNLRWSNQ